MAAERQDTFDRIKAIITEKLKLDDSQLKPDATLQDLGADSLDMVEIILKVEEEFSIEIDDEDAEQLHTMNEVVDYVHKKRS